jgi:hypothetical protein
MNGHKVRPQDRPYTKKPKPAGAVNSLEELKGRIEGKNKT